MDVTERAAKKEYICDKCGEAIAIGDKYVNIYYILTESTERYHTKCWKV